jgi:excisionase family DNA binding protein
MNKKLLTTKEAAEKLGITVRRVQAMIVDDRLKAQKLGRDYVIEEADLESVKERKAGRPKQINGSQK